MGVLKGSKEACINSLSNVFKKIDFYLRFFHINIITLEKSQAYLHISTKTTLMKNDK